MANGGGWDQKVMDYVLRTGVREHPVLAKCREETLARQPMAEMQISPDQGAFMGQMAQLLGARHHLEVGVFTGYSALAVALAVPEIRITACDISEDFVNVARGYWQEAGVAERITAHVGPARDTLAALIAEGRAGAYDMAFIDADKTGYDAYYESCLTLLRPGGLIVLDNTLFSGSVADPANTGASSVALRALNAKLHEDERIDLCLLPIRDGVTLCRIRN